LVLQTWPHCTWNSQSSCPGPFLSPSSSSSILMKDVLLWASCYPLSWC
jgi:hypothetical protein